jgi:hemerythrin-like metal-binding protein
MSLSQSAPHSVSREILPNEQGVMTMAIEWNEKFGTGNGQIDAQHRRLFDMLNNLERRINEGEAPSKMVDVFDDLADYIKEHFCFEEECMEFCACSASAINKMEHLQFLRKLCASLEDLKLQKPTLKVFESLHAELSKWICSHVCRIDRALRAIP